MTLEQPKNHTEQLAKANEDLRVLHHEFVTMIQQTTDEAVSDAHRDQLLADAREKVENVIKQSGLAPELFPHAIHDIEHTIRQSYSARSLKREKLPNQFV